MLGKHPITEPYPQPPTLIPNLLTVRFLNLTCRPHWTTTVFPWPLGTGGHCKLLLGAGSLVHLYVAGWRGILCQNASPPWLGLHQGAIDPLLQSVGALAPRLPVRVILNSGLHRGQKSTGPFTLSGKTLTQKWAVSAQGHYWGDLAKRGKDPVGIYSGPGPQLLASYPSNHVLSCENSRWAMAV